jgi:hypothetical protein
MKRVERRQSCSVACGVKARSVAHFQAREQSAPTRASANNMATATTESAAVIVLLDASQSMRRYAEDAREVLRSFLSQQMAVGPAGGVLCVYTFAAGTRLIFWGRSDSLSEEKVERIAAEVTFDGPATLLYDAICLTLGTRPAASTSFLVITGGSDTGSRATHADAQRCIAALQEAGGQSQWLQIGPTRSNDVLLADSHTLRLPPDSRAVSSGTSQLSRLTTRRPSVHDVRMPATTQSSCAPEAPRSCALARSAATAGGPPASAQYRDGREPARGRRW